MSNILTVIRSIEKQVRGFDAPYVTAEAKKRDPYKVLISCILSLRTKDKTTGEAAARLFKAADTPAKLVKLSRERIQRLIYPVGFYRNKSGVILDISRRLIKEYKGKVPDNADELLSFKGVGPKTANLVLGLGFGKPAICVDTHVHRISNRLGWVKTRNPQETEYALQKIIPRAFWIELNTSLVAFGQNICVPVSPWCSRCSVRYLCPQKGVSRYR
jgi:endonuclease-3